VQPQPAGGAEVTVAARAAAAPHLARDRRGRAPEVAGDGAHGEVLFPEGGDGVSFF
jgi:hypothetical protein